MSKTFDILGLGCTAVDEILYVPRYPQPDDKVQVQRRERHGGGLCSTALIAAARLGARCAYAGTLGKDTDSVFVEQALQREGVDVRHVIHRAGAGPVHSVVVVDQRQRTRTIFYEVNEHTGADARRPSRKLIESSAVLLVDRFGIPGMLRAARLARKNGIPVVADFESAHMAGFPLLLDLVDHLILSMNFALQLTGERTMAEAMKALWNRARAAVVLTGGSAGCWSIDSTTTKPRHLPAFRVRTVDTTGCGDVFHGAYALALARGMCLEERLRFASAAAALKSEGRGHEALPRLSSVRRLLKNQPVT